MSDMVFRFPAPGPEPMLTDLEGWTKIEGTPTMKTWVQHTSLDGSVISGTWEATPGTWHAAYKFYEFVHLIAEDTHQDALRLYRAKGYREVARRPVVKGDWQVDASQWVLFVKPV